MALSAALRARVAAAVAISSVVALVGAAAVLLGPVGKGAGHAAELSGGGRAAVAAFAVVGEDGVGVVGPVPTSPDPAPPGSVTNWPGPPMPPIGGRPPGSGSGSGSPSSASGATSPTTTAPVGGASAGATTTTTSPRRTPPPGVVEFTSGGEWSWVKTATVGGTSLRFEIYPADVAVGEPVLFHGKVDYTGAPKALTVDFGDGSRYTRPAGIDQCTVEPAPWSLWLLNGAMHQYAAPGTFTVTATVTTVDCSGEFGSVATALRGAETTVSVSLSVLVRRA